MDLGSVFSVVSDKLVGKKETDEIFLAVKISSHEICAATWQIVGEKVELGEITQAEIGGKEFEDFLSAADQAVSSAVQESQNNKIEIQKVVFGLPFHWVMDGKVTPDRLTFLKRLCKELDLKPLGYVLLSEALENYYKEIEGAPLTAILIEFDAEFGLLTMYRAGKNLGSAPVKAEPETITTEVEKALKKFTQTEILPSRIIIYDSTRNLEAIAQSITAFPWTKSLPFLHFPKVETFAGKSIVKAVAVAGGLQMGGHFETEENGSETQQSESQEFQSEPKTERQAEEEHKIELEEISAQEAGFISAGEFEGVEVSVTRPTPMVQKENFGQLEEITARQDDSTVKSPIETGPSPKIGEALKGIFLHAQKIPGVLKQALSLFFRLFKNPSGSKSKKVVVAAILIASTMFFLLGAVVYSLPKVKVILQVSSPSFDKEVNITVVTDKTSGSATESAKIISGAVLEVSEIGTQKSVATGRKLVGDKARGAVTIYSAGAARLFPSGTVLASGDGLKFNLDREAQVASASDFLSPATVTVPTTAVDIGDKYNLPANTRFSVGNLSTQSYLAKNDSSLAGGNSHEATVVAKEDQLRLSATLSAQLTEKAKIDLEAKLSSSQKLLPNAITSAISKKKFSKDVGAEAETVSLDLTVDFSGVVFSQNDLVTVFSRSFSPDIPAGFILSPDRATVEIKEVKTDKQGNAVLRVRLFGGLIPEIDQNKISTEIAGKPYGVGASHLLKIPGVTNLTIETKPRLLETITKLFFPWKKENISIEIVSQ